MKKLFMFLALIALLPLTVNAEVKDYGDKVYVTKEEVLENYYCEALEDKENIMLEFYADNLVLVDSSDIEAKKYLFDIKDKTCELLTEKEYDTIINTETSNHYGYEWKDDNKIYENVSTKEGIVEKYILQRNFFVQNRTYYILKDGKYELVEEPKESDFESYYYKESFGKANSGFYDYIEYYIEKDKDTLILDETPTEEEYNQGIYYEAKLYNIKPEYFLTLTNTEFILTKEISKLSTNTIFTKEDFANLLMIGDKTYLVFGVDLGEGDFRFVLFDLEGNLIQLHDKYFFDYIDVSSENGLFTATSTEENKTNIYILDNEFNLVFNKTINEPFLMVRLLTSKEHIDYFNYIESFENEEVYNIIEVRKYYLVNKDDKYNNKDMNFTLNADLKDLKSVFINGKEISKDNYTVKDNVLTLSNKYLSKLKKDTYKLKVLYNDDGYVETDFQVDIANPNTLDNIMKSFILGTISLIGLIATILYIKKRKLYN